MVGEVGGNGGRGSMGSDVRETNGSEVVGEVRGNVFLGVGEGK